MSSVSTTIFWDEITQRLININPELEEWPRIFGGFKIIRMMAIFAYLQRTSHGINACPSTSTTEDDNTFYLKMRMMWFYFGNQEINDKWPNVAHAFWVKVCRTDNAKDIVEVVLQEAKAFPNSVSYINTMIRAEKSGNYNNTNPSLIQDWQQELCFEGDLVTTLQEKVIMIGLGNFKNGVCKFLTMQNPVIEISIIDDINN
jgi:hypothetical protein